MKIYIHYTQQRGPGYEPRPPLRLFNVDRVLDAGPRMVKVKGQFTDDVFTHDHVVRVVIELDENDSEP